MALAALMEEVLGNESSQFEALLVSVKDMASRVRY